MKLEITILFNNKMAFWPVSINDCSLTRYCITNPSSYHMMYYINLFDLSFSIEYHFCQNTWNFSRCFTYPQIILRKALAINISWGDLQHIHSSSNLKPNKTYSIRFKVQESLNVNELGQREMFFHHTRQTQEAQAATGSLCSNWRELTVYDYIQPPLLSRATTTPKKGPKTFKATHI